MCNIKKEQENILKDYDKYIDSVRKTVNKRTQQTLQPQDPAENNQQTFTTGLIYRRMKFVKENSIFTPFAPPYVEGHLDNTKLQLVQHLDRIFSKKATNITTKEIRSLKKLRKNPAITIKPADKNLGTVILDTAVYIKECLKHLASESYIRVDTFPTVLQQQLENLILSFREDIDTYSPALYRYLRVPPNRLPRFYGLPKVHKISEIVTTPPIRPIVSHTNSLLSPYARLIDHVLQPVVRQYPDYLHNSEELINILSSFHVKEDVLLVSMDVINLYPSIPQKECLDILHREIKKHQNLLLLDPNFIIQLLAINMSNNYFEFGNAIFKQTTGIPMGAAFSPTVANIYMSVLLQRFLSTTREKPLLLRRYIDDIFLIWPQNYNLSAFFNLINNFHPNIKFTINSSPVSIDFLDITIYKGPLMNTHQVLDIKTYQKEQNLFQYLHFTSQHPKSTFKAIITGECIRYARTNSQESNYQYQVQLLHTRLQRRGYPEKFITKYTEKISFSNRNQYLLPTKPSPSINLRRPIFKCRIPPQFHQLKEIILSNYQQIKKFIDRPIFATVKHQSLQNILVRAKYNPTHDETLTIHQLPSSKTHTSTWKPRNLSTPKPSKCNRRNCATCQHFNTTDYFRSSVTKQRFRIKIHDLCCSTKNIIYLITCTKCKKQYVGLTRKTLRERINHHRSTILTKQPRYISSHFRLPDHSITNLSVQIIDSTKSEELAELERYWIQKLQTTTPKGLNYIDY